MSAKNAWEGFAPDRAFAMHDLIQAVLAYDRWTPFTLLAVKLTILFIVVVDLLAVVKRRVQEVFMVLLLPALVVVPCVAFAALAVLLNALWGDPPYTFQLARFYALWVVVLVLWSYLFAQTCIKPTDFRDRLEREAHGSEPAW
jgi:hypothetical protein